MLCSLSHDTGGCSCCCLGSSLVGPHLQQESCPAAVPLDTVQKIDTVPFLLGGLVWLFTAAALLVCLVYMRVCDPLRRATVWQELCWRVIIGQCSFVICCLVCLKFREYGIARVAVRRLDV